METDKEITMFYEYKEISNAWNEKKNSHRGV
jgi:hypothetical protein